MDDSKQATKDIKCMKTLQKLITIRESNKPCKHVITKN